LARCSATETPTIPAPSTIASVRAMEIPVKERQIGWLREHAGQPTYRTIGRRNHHRPSLRYCREICPAICLSWATRVRRT
jgi:hypothetical protein